MLALSSYFYFIYNTISLVHVDNTLINQTGAFYRLKLLKLNQWICLMSKGYAQSLVNVFKMWNIQATIYFSIVFMWGISNITAICYFFYFIICSKSMLLKLLSCIGLVSSFHMFHLLGKCFDVQGRSVISSAASLDGRPSSANNRPATWI